MRNCIFMRVSVLCGLLCLNSYNGVYGADILPVQTPADSTNKVMGLEASQSIVFPHFEPQLPPGPGRDEFMRACTTCHSPRYVTMQPPFSRKQWGEIVSKMVNAYGTTADEFQMNKITDYLDAVYGVEARPPSPASSSSSSDDDFSSSPGPVTAEPTEPAPQFEDSTNVMPEQVLLQHGKDVFASDCSGCHGVAGQGNGPVAQALLPRPTALSSLHFSTEFMRQTLWSGLRGTSMPSWRKLPLQDLAAVTAYVQSLNATGNSETMAADSLKAAKALFLKDCAACHGVNGDGKSPIASTLNPPPASFRSIQPDSAYIQAVLRDGMPGTAMPPWKGQLSESDQVLLAAYIRSLYQSGNRN